MIRVGVCIHFYNCNIFYLLCFSFCSSYSRYCCYCIRYDATCLLQELITRTITFIPCETIREQRSENDRVYANDPNTKA